MHKLVILIEQLEDWTTFDDAWPQFLHAAEQMPGLRLEATSRVDVSLFGKLTYALMHELFFDSREAAQQAMASAEGRETGRLLQVMTRGRMSLFLADHKEDNLENIRKHRTPAEPSAGG
jgi:uncharacterized protein (TIGR02118 family)